MENDSFRLIVRRGPRPNEVYELAGEVLNLGRDITNDIVINDREVSRHHLRFTKAADGITIEDLGSTNGTFINGKRLTGAAGLKNGDMVGLGETVTLQFEAGGAGTEAPSPVQQAPAPAPAPPPQNDADSAYRPPAQQPAPQAPAQASPPPQPAVPQADPYSQSPAQQPPQQAQYQPSDAYAPPQDYYDGQGAAAASYGPPPPGYDYDPYAMREEEGGGTSQWLMIGCVGLLLLCCCLTVVAGVAIDCFVLWDDIPVLSNILEALAIPVNTTDPSCITF